MTSDHPRPDGLDGFDPDDERTVVVPRGEPEDERTVVVDRVAEAAGAAHDATEADIETVPRSEILARRRAGLGLPPDVEETVVVDREVADGDTVVVAHPDPAEETVVVDRAVADGDTIVVAPADAAEETIVVDRGVADGDTVVGGSVATDATVVVPRRASEDSGTNIVSGRPAGDLTASDPAGLAAPRVSTASASVPPLVAPALRPRGGKRRGIAPPPVPEGFAPAARPAVGPGAVEAYAPRPAETRRLDPAPAGGTEPTRDPARTVPAMGRRAERLARRAVIAFAAALVVSVGGLVALAIAVL